METNSKSDDTTVLSGEAEPEVAKTRQPVGFAAVMQGINPSAMVQAAQPGEPDESGPVAPPTAAASAEPTPGAPPSVDGSSDGDSIPTDEEIEKEIIDVLRTCYDPEIPVNIYDLGLIYDIKLDETRNVHIKMTLTSPMCPVAGSLPPEVQNKAASVEGVSSAKVDVVWDPPWTQDMMGEAAKIKLGLDL